ncbi:MAG: DUF3579 domain-containing protein [Gammaproteobacteria bacterium]|jgi:hypothetical protein|nr:DUF3579 domain-containing protein [Gammaproteobacteria bacterium]MBU0772006.1 DUF3579 domain-containing protein [Gammaproteobacteria bacterium]MBU0857028.1 DUF3579 domain-containing protein [Gammaproteobacteria bacterium]MBU1845767.1 DUF3579 domain-containing protein [Gammaproteobacteria bacterium]
MSAIPQTHPATAPVTTPANEPLTRSPDDDPRRVRSFTIIGATSAGKTFRPSDWSDRLCGVMSSFGSQRKMRYSPFVRPGCWITGEKCVFVDARLYDLEPLAYNFLMHFARDNDLRLDYETGASEF